MASTTSRRQDGAHLVARDSPRRDDGHSCGWIPRVEKVALSKGKAGGKLLSLNISLATYFNLSDEAVARATADRRRG